MAAPGLIEAPDDRPDRPTRERRADRAESLAERLLDVQAPQRPQSAPAIRIEVDGRIVEGREGQTILEVCRDNGIEVPTLCYEPKLPGFGACRMCVVEVEGEEHPPISCSRVCEPGMKVQTQTEEVRRLRATNLELIFSDHNAYCLPPCQNKCPSHIDIPGFLKQNAEGEWRESTRIFKRTIPFPSVLGRVCPAPCEEHCRRDEVDEAIAIRDAHRYAGDQVIKSMLDDGIDPPLPVRAAAEERSSGGRDRVRAGRDGRRLLPPAGRSRRDGLRARPGAGRDAPLRHPPVPPAEDRGPRGRVRVGHPARRHDRLRPGARARLHPRRPPGPGLRRGPHRDRLLRHEQARDPERGRRRGHRRTRVPPDGDARAALSRVTPASGSWSSAAGSPRWTAPGRPSARAPPRSPWSTAGT